MIFPALVDIDHRVAYRLKCRDEPAVLRLQLLFDLMAVECDLNRRAQLMQFDRPANEVVAFAVRQGFNHPPIRAFAQKHDRYAKCFSERNCGFEPVVSALDTNIQQDEVWTPLGNLCESLFRSFCGRERIVAKFLQRGLGVTGDDALFLNHQDRTDSAIRHSSGKSAESPPNPSRDRPCGRQKAQPLRAG